MNLLSNATTYTLSFIAIAFSSLLPVGAQETEAIYLIDESAISGIELLEINEKKVKYKSKAGKSASLSTSQIVLVFNQVGEYLTFPLADKPKIDSKRFVSNTEKRPVDLIVTLDQKVIPAHIVTVNEYELFYTDPDSQADERTIGKEQLAIILYQDGRHELLVSPSQASDILSLVKLDKLEHQKKAAEAAVVVSAPEIAVPQPIYVSNRQPIKKEPAKDTAPKEPAGEVAAAGAPVQEKEVEKKVLQAAVPLNQPALAESAPATAETAPKAVTEKKEVPANSTGEAVVKIDFDLYSRKALQRTEDLGTYLSIVSEKNTDWIEANKAIDQACKLFIDEEALVEVTNNTAKSRYKIRQYFNRLKLLKYDRVDISWTDVNYVSDLKKGVDGNYYGIITLQQRFKGYLDNKLVYSDVTEKNVEVILKTYTKETEGAVSEQWDVFLSDIGVVETKYK